MSTSVIRNEPQVLVRSFLDSVTVETAAGYVDLYKIYNVDGYSLIGANIAPSYASCLACTAIRGNNYITGFIRNLDAQFNVGDIVPFRITLTYVRNSYYQNGIT